jgi:hypothetical protein
VDDLLKKARRGYALFAGSPRSHPDSVSGVASATLRGLRPTFRLPKGATQIRARDGDDQWPAKLRRGRNTNY